MKFSEKLKKAMQQLGINQAQVVRLTGKSKGSVSMYLSDKTVPPESVQSDIAVSLGLAPDYFEQEEPILKFMKSGQGVIPQLHVEDVAKLMRKDEKTIRDGLRQGRFEWGYGIKTSSRWTFFINATAFAEKEKIAVPQEMIF